MARGKSSPPNNMCPLPVFLLTRMIAPLWSLATGDRPLVSIASG